MVETTGYGQGPPTDTVSRLDGRSNAHSPREHKKRVISTSETMKRGKKRARRTSRRARNNNDEEDEDYIDQQYNRLVLEINRIGPQIVSAQMHSPTAKMHSPRRLPRLLAESRTRLLLSPKSPERLMSEQGRFVRPQSRVLERSLQVLDMSEGRAMTAVDVRSEIMTPQQRRHRNKLDELIRQVKEIRSPTSPEVPLEVEPCRMKTMDTKRNNNTGVDRVVSDIPFGALAFERMSWVPAQKVDLRLWTDEVHDFSLPRLFEVNATCTSLDLRGCVKLCDEGLVKSIEKCPGLETLRLSGCVRISDEGIERALEICGESLIELDLGKYYSIYEDVSINCPCCSRKMKRVQGIALTAEPRDELKLSPKAIRSVARYCPNLRQINLSSQNDAVTNESMSWLAMSCKRLSEFDVSNCTKLGQEAMKVIGSNCAGSLAAVNVRNCQHINDDGIRELVGKSYHIRELDISKLSKLTDDGVRGFLEAKVMWGFRAHGGFIHLKELNLRECPLLTDVSISWIASGCPNVQKLDFTDCSHLKDYGLRTLGQLEHLQTLILSGCQSVTDQGILHLIAPRMERLQGSRSTTKLLGKLNHIALNGVCVSDKSMISLVECLSKTNGVALKAIELEFNPFVTDGFLRNLALHAQEHLRTFSLSGNDSVTAAGIGALGLRCKRLVALKTSNCAQIAEDSIRTLTYLRHIEYFDISNCVRVGKESALMVPNWKLQHLEMSNNVHVNDQVMMELLELCQELQVLNVSFCKVLTDRFLEAVVTSRLHTVNVAGCALVLDHALEECAKKQRAFRGSPWSMVGLKSASFRGLVPDPRFRTFQHQNNFKMMREKEQLGAISIQCFCRQRHARKVLANLRHERLLLEQRSAVIIQKNVRRCLARIFIKELRHELIFLACRVQCLWRLYHNRKLRERALRFWKNRTLRLVFQTWVANSSQQARQRREEEARKKAAQAFKFWTTSTNKKIFMAWKIYLAHCRWKNERYPKALKFFKHQATGRAFATWTEYTKPRVLRRKNLLKVFLNCVPLTHRNATSAKSSIYVAVKYENKCVKKHAFLALSDAVKLAKTQYMVAMEFMRSQFMAPPGGAERGGRMGFGFQVFNAWKLFATSQKQTRLKEARLSEQTEQYAKRRALRLLDREAKRRIKTRQQTRVALNLLRNAALLKSFSGWVARANAQKVDRQKAQQALRFLKNSTLLKFFRSWHEATLHIKENERKVKACLNKMFHQTLNKYFNEWVEVYKVRIRFKRNAANRMKYRKLTNLFSKWIAFTSWNRAKRHNQLMKWVQLNNVAVRIQSRWRGMRGREQIEDDRIMAQFMATKIQTRIRIYLARKELVRMERRRILKEYVFAEKETDLMMLEDQDGHAMRAEYNAARLVQLHFRSKQSRELVYVAKREAQRRRELRRKENQRKMKEEHERKEEERKKDLEMRHLHASKFQALYRGMVARKEYRMIWIKQYDNLYVIKIQTAYRSRAARLEFAARTRHKHFEQQTREQQRMSSKILRLMGMRNRRLQESGGKLLDSAGLHPDSFTLDKQKLVVEVFEDMKTWSRVARSHFEAFRRAGTDANRRAEIIHAFHQRLEDEAWVRKGDAVKIISMQSPYRGMTGMILNLRAVGTIAGGQQAAVKLDSTGEIIYLGTKTIATASEESSNSMIRIDTMAKNYEESKVTKALVEQNREKLLEKIEEIAKEFRKKRAAIRMQQTMRAMTARNVFGKEKTKQMLIDERKQKRVLRILKKLGMDNAQTGDALVAFGIINPRSLPPNLPEKPFAIELWLKRRKLNQELKKFTGDCCDIVISDYRQRIVTTLKTKKLDDLEREEEGLLRRKTKSHFNLMLLDDDADGSSGSLSTTSPSIRFLGSEKPQLKTPKLEKLMDGGFQARLRWRHRTRAKAVVWKMIDIMTDHILAPAAEKVDSKAQNMNSRLARAMLRHVAKVVGGPEWRRSPEERLTWIGAYQFPQLVCSGHVNLQGYAVYHGVWNRAGIPNGYGILEFPDGKGMKNILKKYAHYLSHDQGAFSSGSSSGKGSNMLIRSKSFVDNSKYYQIKEQENDDPYADEEGCFTDSDDERNYLEENGIATTKTVTETPATSSGGDGPNADENEDFQAFMKRLGNISGSGSIGQRSRHSSVVVAVKQNQQRRRTTMKRKTMIGGAGKNKRGSKIGPQPVAERKIQYQTIAATVYQGMIRGDVLIKYCNGAKYEGPFVDEFDAALAKQQTLNKIGKSNASTSHAPKFLKKNNNNKKLMKQPLSLVGSHHSVAASSSLLPTFLEEKMGEEHGDTTQQLQQDVLEDGGEPDLTEPEFKKSDHFGIWTTPQGVIYEGEEVTNHFDEDHINGLLRVTWKNGESYFGDVVEGERHGSGKMIYANGDEYKGGWQQDHPHGYGTYMWGASRTVYVGQFSNGKQHGKGRQTFADGARYQGQYENDVFHGKGKLKTAEGDMYAGDFQYGIYDGYGEILYADGSSYKGGWKNGIRHSPLGEFSEFTDTEGNTYVIAFVDDEMDGQGRLFEVTSNHWKLEKHGVWKRGKFLHWIGVSANPDSTNEFCDRFVRYGDYTGVYGSMVAQILPELPPGVDPEDRRVEQHVDGILRRAGPLAGTKIIAKSLEALANYGPIHLEAKVTYEESMEKHKQTSREFNILSHQVDLQTKLVQDLNENVMDLRGKIKSFWKDDEDAYQKKRRFKRIVHRLKKYEHSDWFACRMATYTPLLWTFLWEGMARILLPILDDAKTVPKKELDKLCNTSSTNMELGDMNALLRDYDCKLIDEVIHFNVYERGKCVRMLTEVSKSVYHREMNPTNEELAHITPLSPYLVIFLKAIYEYTVKAAEITPVVDEMRSLEIDLDVAKKKLLHLVKDKADCEQRLREWLQKAMAAEFEHEHTAARMKEVEMNLERAMKFNELAKEMDVDAPLKHKFTREIERDEDLIVPWLSREDEYIRNQCQERIDYMLDLVCDIEPEIWDCIITMRELSVCQGNYEEQYGKQEEEDAYVFPEVRDLLGDMVNRVSGFEIAELAVEDLMNDLLLQLEGGPSQEMGHIMDEILFGAEERYHFMERARQREESYAGKRVTVMMPEGFKKFGTCKTTYDFDLPIYAPIQPGTGVICCNEYTYEVFGLEDTCQFLSEMEPGDVLCLPGISQEIVERPIYDVVYDYHLVLSETFDSTVSHAVGKWTKDWGYRKVNEILELIPSQGADIIYDDGLEESQVLIDRIEIVLDDDDDNDDVMEREESEKVDILEDNDDEKEERESMETHIDDDRPLIDYQDFQIWQVFEDDNGEPYFHCKHKGITTWTEPPHFDHIWFEFEDEETGYLYWSNFKETTWIKPEQ